MSFDADMVRKRRCIGVLGDVAVGRRGSTEEEENEGEADRRREGEREEVRLAAGGEDLTGIEGTILL